MAEGIELARRMLVVPPPDCDSPFVDQMLIALSPNIARDECSPLARAARKVRSSGILCVAVCTQHRCRDSRCLRNEVASSPRYFFSSLNELNRIYQVVERIRNDLAPITHANHPDLINITVKDTSIVEHLAEGVEYIPGSAVPEAELSTDGRRLTWPAIKFLPKDGLTLTYQTRPLISGQIQISEGAEVAWRDNQNREGKKVLPTTSVLVLGGREQELLR